MAPPDAQAEASYGFFGCFVLLPKVASSSDRLGTIDLPLRRASIGVLQCRAIVPNGSTRRASGGVLRLFRLFCLTAYGAFKFRSIGDNRSTIATRKHRSLTV